MDDYYMNQIPKHDGGKFEDHLANCIAVAALLGIVGLFLKLCAIIARGAP